jgi:predicted O-methyltransferase YrrM
MVAPEFASADDIPFRDAAELRYASKNHAQQLVSSAHTHNVSLATEAADRVVTLAAASGYLPYVPLRLSDSKVIYVTDDSSFEQSMTSFFEDVACGRLPLPSSTFEAPQQPTARRILHESLKDTLLRHMPERLLIRWFSERLVQRAAAEGFPAAQVPSEIRKLLQLIAAHRPHSVLEIGTNYGGTTYLFSRVAAPDAVLVTCDIARRIKRGRLESIARRGQRIEFLEIDSHSNEGESKIRATVPDGVDLLFIDGDHSYEGVRQDFITFADLLRPSGLLVFHDIVQDYEARYGVRTNAYVGGVPRFWRELRAALPPTFRFQEIVGDPHQDGFGIGVLVCPDSASPGQELANAYRSAPQGAPRTGLARRRRS